MEDKGAIPMRPVHWENKTYKLLTELLADISNVSNNGLHQLSLKIQVRNL